MAKERFKGATCPNCGAHYVEALRHASFCPGCGQENHDLNVPVRDLVAEGIETLFHLDSKSFRTLRALALAPGLLTTEFLRGRRVRYVMPVRLYILISFVFFLVLALPPARRADGTAPRAEGPGMTVLGMSMADISQASDLDALMRARGVAPTAFKRHLLEQAGRIARGGPGELKHLLLKGMSYMMFVLMPVFGGLLYLFFRKSEPHYVGSLVFSLHYHSFAFLLLTAVSLLTRIPDLGFVLLLAPFVLVAYLVLALRRVYQRRWTGTLQVAAALGPLHLVAVIVLLWATVMIGILIF